MAATSSHEAEKEVANLFFGEGGIRGVRFFLYLTNDICLWEWTRNFPPHSSLKQNDSKKNSQPKRLGLARRRPF